MKKIKLKNKNIFHYLFFYFTLFFSLLITNLYYLSTNSPDFEKYYKYVLFFENKIPETGNVQGILYYWVSYFFLTINKSAAGLDNLQNYISVQIQFVNFLFYIIGLYGTYKLLKKRNFKTSNILLVLSIVNFFPTALAMRLTFKTEIIAFTLLPFIFLYFENYLDEKNPKYLYYLLFPLCLLISLKGSIFGMIFVLILILVYKNKTNFLIIPKTYIFLFCLIFLTIFIENNKINSNSIFQEQHNQKYDNKINLDQISSKLFSENKSMLTVILSDTFGDEFDLYWDFGEDYFAQNRKNFITNNFSNNILELNLKFKEINYVGKGSSLLINLDKIREYIGTLISLFFYLLLLFISFIDKKNSKYYLLPFIGILIVLINAFGFPSNNFDPNMFDVFKSHYYSFFLTISFIFLNLKIIEKLKIFKYFFILLLIFTNLFIIGFPKANTVYFDNLVSYRQQNSTFCNFNFTITKNTLNNDMYKGCPKNYELVCLHESNYSKVNEILVYNQFYLFSNSNNKTLVSSEEECIKLAKKGYNTGNFTNSIKVVPYFQLSIFFIFLLQTIIVNSQYNFIKNAKNKILNSTKFKLTLRKFGNILYILQDFLLCLGYSLVCLFSLTKINNSKVIVVTASDTSHFRSSLQLIRSLQISNKNLEIIYYNLGLTREEMLELKSYNVKIKNFKFDNYPEFFQLHKQDAGAYAWKPTILWDEIKNSNNLTIWMDAGDKVTKNLFFIKVLLLKIGFYSPLSNGYVYEWTHQDTLDKLNIDSYYFWKRNLNAAIIGVNPNNLKIRKFIKNWRDYSQKKEIILPNGANKSNHRWDQAIITTTFYRDFNKFIFPRTHKIFGIFTHQDID